MTRAGLVLDRDGTLVDVVRDEETGVVVTAFHPAQLRLLPGVVEGLARAERAGLVLAIATNQPGPAKGQCSAAAVTRTNDALVALLAASGVHVAAVEVCMHHPLGGAGGDSSLVFECACRKPKAGMLASLAARLGLDPAKSWLVGDTASDVLAARAGGFSAALVHAAGRCELCPLRDGPSVRADVVGETLDAVVASILAR